MPILLSESAVLKNFQTCAGFFTYVYFLQNVKQQYGAVRVSTSDCKLQFVFDKE